MNEEEMKVNDLKKCLNILKKNYPLLGSSL